MTDELLQVARDIEDMKRECGIDPESPVATYNSRLMSIAYRVRALAQTEQASAAGEVFVSDAAFERIAQLLCHIENTVSDEEWEALDPKIWNAVSQLATRPRAQTSAAPGSVESAAGRGSEQS